VYILSNSKIQQFPSRLEWLGLAHFWPAKRPTNMGGERWTHFFEILFIYIILFIFQMIILSTVIFTLGAAICAVGISKWILLLGRVLLGIAIGLLVAKKK
jgi:hypothetical protein